MEQRFGIHNVAAIGTYTTLKLKAAFRDLLRLNGENPQNINYFAGFISESGNDFDTLFHEAAQSNKLKEFITEHSNSVNDISLILGQPKSASVHAAGVIITPTERNGEPMQIYDWIPCKKIDGVLVTEWEGVQLEEAGFLKADILGLSQLDKLHAILATIEDRTGERINLNTINTKDPAVFELFKKGLTQDVFQFTTDGLAAYCREVKPDSIEELAAMNALYRPGAMDSGAHVDYVKIKHGKKEPEYLWGCEEIMKDVFGLMIFQETTMRICQVIGGFDENTSDSIRSSIGKKKVDKIKEYKDQFVEGAKKNGCPEYEAHNIWNKIEGTATYQFNRSHSVAYSLIGYQTQWLKKYYPLEFWTTSLHHADDDEIPKRISELNKFEGIKLNPPDVNKSKSTFYTDWETNQIYWSLSRISHVGEVALKHIEEERTKNGSFFSLEEFISRCKSQAVNSRVVKNLILSGCFDELHKIDFLPQRLKLIEEFCKLYKLSVPLEFTTTDVYKEFFWYRTQRELSGYGYFDYGSLLTDRGYHFSSYILPDQMQLSDNEGWEGNVCGIINEVVERKTKKGPMGKITIDHNNDLIDIVLWNDKWVVYKDAIESNVGNGLIVSGQVKYDGYNKKNVMYSTDKTEIEIF